LDPTLQQGLTLLGLARQQDPMLAEKNSTNPTSNEKKKYNHPTFVQYIKSLINLF
jgi:hypothetical protein